MARRKLVKVVSKKGSERCKYSIRRLVIKMGYHSKACEEDKVSFKEGIIVIRFIATVIVVNANRIPRLTDCTITDQ